jgi:esterase/lipase superfamily enzyme
MPAGGDAQSILSLMTAAITIVVQSCNSRPSNADLQPVPTLVGLGEAHKTETIFVSTNRGQEQELEPYFNKKRSIESHYAKFGISVPQYKNRDAYTFDTPGVGPLNPEKHFFATSSELLDNEAVFGKQLKEHIQGNANSKKVWIYVHGVYTHFAEGVFFISQLNRYSGLEGTPLLFSWPSGGKWLDYLYDKDSADTSRDALESTIRIASESGAEEVFILAHSLGCHLTMETLRQAAIAGDATFGGKLKCVLLASPDISVDVFESQLQRMNTLPSKPRMGVLLSRDDKLLKIAKLLARGGERLGSEDNTKMRELGVDVFDLTGYHQKGVSSHYKFAALPTSLENVYNQMLANQKSGEDATVYLVLQSGEFYERVETNASWNFSDSSLNPFRSFGGGDDPSRVPQDSAVPIPAVDPVP